MIQFSGVFQAVSKMNPVIPRTFICLAAGKGARMGRISSYLQKCMYPIDGLPFVEYTMRELERSALFRPGETEVVFVVGHHAEQLSSYFGAQYAGARLRFVRQESTLGTAHAVQTALDSLSDPGQFITWLGDAFFPARTFEAIAAHNESVVVTLVKDAESGSVHHRVDCEGDFVSRAWRGSSPYVEAGLWKLEPQVMTASRPAPDGEYRLLYVLDHYIQQGNAVGFVTASEGIQLGTGRNVRDAELIDAIGRVSDAIH